MKKTVLACQGNSDEIMLYDSERIDDTGFGGYKVVQGPGFSYGVDAVLLAAFAAGETGCKVKALKRTRNTENSANLRPLKIADLGTGNGIIPFILAHKIPTAEIVGYEVQQMTWERAFRGLQMNGLEERVNFVRGDILEIEGDGSYDMVVSNPPYFKRGAGIINPDDAKFIARHETSAALKDFLGAASRMLKAGGELFMVHRPSRLVDLLVEMRSAGLEPKEVQMVVPRTGESANIVLIHAIKGAGAELKMLPEIPVHTEGQNYSDLIERIYERRKD